MSGLITLITDFGLADPYVGVMKGVILNRCPSARLIDLTHLVPPQDIAAACLLLEDAHPYFPPGTLHVAVVDPTVGSSRCVLWARTTTAQFLAPDNGLLSFLAPEQIQELRRVENPRYWLHPVSRTFHGRDIFAPVAGELARGLAPARLGPLTRVMHRLTWPQPTQVAEHLRGQVLTFDHFGNARTNLRMADLPSPVSVRVAGVTVPLAGTYAAVPRGTALALVDSSGRLEISVRDGSAQQLLGLTRGTPVELALLAPGGSPGIASPQFHTAAPTAKGEPDAT